MVIRRVDKRTSEGKWGLKDVLVMYDVLKGGVMSVGWCGWVDEPWPEGRVATNKTI